MYVLRSALFGLKKIKFRTINLYLIWSSEKADLRRWNISPSIFLIQHNRLEILKSQPTELLNINTLRIYESMLAFNRLIQRTNSEIPTLALTYNRSYLCTIIWLCSCDIASDLLRTTKSKWLECFWPIQVPLAYTFRMQVARRMDFLEFSTI